MIYSPILQALAILFVVFGLSFLFLPPILVNEILDAYSIAAAALVLFRYRKPIWRSIRTREPDGADCLYFSIGGIATSIAVLRILREFGLDLGVVALPNVQYAFAMITVLMMFSLFLKTVAPPVPFRPDLSLSPWAALALAVVSGSILAGIILMFRYS